MDISNLKKITVDDITFNIIINAEDSKEIICIPSKKDKASMEDQGLTKIRTNLLKHLQKKLNIKLTFDKVATTSYTIVYKIPKNEITNLLLKSL